MLDIRVIIDMVVNHTSTQHPWFLNSVSSRNSSKRDWYIWKDPVNGREPNNWESFFEEAPGRMWKVMVRASTITIPLRKSRRI